MRFLAFCNRSSPLIQKFESFLILQYSQLFNSSQNVFVLDFYTSFFIVKIVLPILFLFSPFFQQYEPSFMSDFKSRGGADTVQYSNQNVKNPMKTWKLLTHVTK